MVLFLKWKPLLPIITLCLFLFFFEDWISIPSCTVLPNHDQHDVVKHTNTTTDEDDLKVMLVANLLLLGSDTSFFNLYFRDYYMSKFFQKSFYSLKPDMLLVMGDVSARGFQLTRSKWVSVLLQFHRMLGPFVQLPFHVVLGDRDVGECSGLDANFVYWIASSFPGLDSSGCGAFDIGNVSFVSLNAVALLCGNDNLRFSVEKAIEMERIGLGREMDDYGEFTARSDSFGQRENAMSSGFGPVLLLHFPLHRKENGDCKKGKVVKKDPGPLRQGLNSLEARGLTDGDPYELLHTVPPNATEYIFRALKPRIIFSAHTHEFCDHTHSDGTREVTVPAMTWKVSDNPGFIFATFRSERNAVSVSYCSLARESDVLMAYTLVLLLFLTAWLVANTHYHRSLRN